MAGSAIVARLQLDSKDYDKKLEQAKRKTSDFSRGGVGSIGELMNKFGALAAAVGGCKVAMDAFNAVMNSSQTYSDTYANAMASVKGVVDNVVYSLANADFSSFERGLRKVAEASWAASAALDQLWNTKQSASYFTNKNRAQLAELLNEVRDESKTAEQRKQAQAMIDAVIADQAEVVAVARQDVDKAVFAMINDAAGGRLSESQVNKALIEETLRIDVSLDRDRLKKEIKDGYAEYRKLSQEIYEANSKWETKTDSMGRIVSQSKVVSEEGKAALAALDAKYADIIVKHSTLEVMSDEELASLIEQLNYAEQQTKLMEKMVAQRVAVNNQLAKQLPMEQQITSEYKKRDVKMAGIPTSTTSAPLVDKIDFEVPMVIPATTEGLADMTDKATNAADAFAGLGSTMSSLSSIVGEDAAGWLEWGAGVAQAVATAIPQIAALTTAKSGEATANTAAAASGAASSVASIPFAGPVLAVAAVASIVAALANLPKFATGGVVPGNMMSGDNVLIRANSGEVVLTKTQANNIGSMLNGGMNGKVVFEIRGDKLKGVLDNYNKTKAYGVR